MLKKRQIEILLDLFENAGNYMTASEFTKKFDVSLRTIQNDMRQIRLFLNDMTSPCVKMESEAPKGTRITISDPDGFDKFKVKLYQEYMETTANSLRNQDRIRLLLLTLLDKFRPVSYYELESTLYVSHSTLINDLKMVDDILQKYHLDLMRNAKKIMIDGYEIGKRLCISKVLREIRFSFGIDLTNDMNLRTALGLHCSALFLRITYNMQIKNHLVDHIRQTYPQGFDVASFFASMIEKNIEKKMTGEEIAYLAIHLYSAIAEKQKRSGQLKVLVISSLRRSENILLRQTLIEWFPDSIDDLFIVHPDDMNESYLDKYDTFLTTEKGSYYNMGLAMYINQFPTRQDYLNLKLAMDGFQSIQDILDIFHHSLYIHFKAPTTKEQILQDMCKKAEEFFGTTDLYDAVMSREDMRSTFFGNSTAAPHPLVAVSSNTFVCIGISDTPVQWDSDNNMVNLILLIDVSKNNAKAFQIWNYLSNIFADKLFVPRLLKNPGYDQFIELLKISITGAYNMPI